MPMPEKNYFWDQLPLSCDVYLRGKKNVYYVAVIDGKEGVVNWSGQQALKAQADLEKRVEATRDRKAKEKGFQYKIYVEGVETPFYFKFAAQVGPFMREMYPKQRIPRIDKL